MSNMQRNLFNRNKGYCLNCKKNLCTSCEFEHDEHEIISYGKILKKKKEIIENNDILRKNIDKLKIIIQKIINKLNNVMDVIEQYYEINKNIIKNINNKNRNYETLFNINSMNHNHIFDDINNIINEKDINIQFENIIKIYNSMDFKNEILFQYKINKDAKKINLFGSEFVRNNKNICKYIHENKEYELSRYF